MTDKRTWLLLVSACAAALVIPSLAGAAPAEDAVLEALTAKGGAVKDYHYRVEWTTTDGVPVSTAEVWYAGSERMRLVRRYVEQSPPPAEVILKGDYIHHLEPRRYEVNKGRASDGRASLLASGEGAMGPVFLSRELLALWPRVDVTGRETVAEAPCDVVDLTSTITRLSADIALDLPNFVAYVPQAGEAKAEGYRFWVHADTGMVMRWAVLGGDQTRVLCEVTEIQQIDGFPFPSLLTRNEDGIHEVGRVTEVTVNQGIAEDVFDLRSPPNWLTWDATITIGQARERLQDDPDNANLHYTIGRSLRPNHDEAAAEFRRAAELAPDSPTPLLALAEVLQWRRWLSSIAPPVDDRDATVDLLREATARAGDHDWELRKRFAQALSGAGTVDEAIAEYHRLMAVGPPLSYSVAGGLAQLLARKGDHAGAYRTVADVPTTAAFWQRPLAAIVDWATQSGSLDDLRTRLAEAAAKHPQSPQLQLLLAQVLHAQGRDEDAVEALKQVPLTFYPGAVVPLAKELGELELVMAEVGPAVREALQSGRVYVINNLRSPEELRPAVDKAFMREAQALWAETADVRSRVALLRTYGSVGEFLYRPGWSQLALDPQEMTPATCAIVAAIDLEQTTFGQRARDARRHAAECLRRALAEWPDDGALWALLGRVSWSAQEWESVAEAYLKAAEADPDQIEYGARAAFALVLVGRCDEALAAGRRAVEPWPDEWIAQAFSAVLRMDCGELAGVREALAASLARAEAEERSFDQRLLTLVLERCHDLRVHHARAAAARGDLERAKALGDEAREQAGDSPDAWRDVAEVYLAAQAWDDALTAAERALALAPEADEPAQMRAEVLAARAYLGKRDDHEARRRLIRVLGRTDDAGVLREAADALVNLYLRRGERDQALSTLNNVRLRSDDRHLLGWVDDKLKAITGD